MNSYIQIEKLATKKGAPPAPTTSLGSVLSKSMSSGPSRSGTAAAEAFNQADAVLRARTKSPASSEAFSKGFAQADAVLKNRAAKANERLAEGLAEQKALENFSKREAIKHDYKMLQMAAVERMKNSPKGWKDLVKGTGSKLLVGLGIGGALTGTGMLVDYLRKRFAEKPRFERAVAEDPKLVTEYGEAALRKRFKALQHLNPHAAKDPILASDFLRQTMATQKSGIPVATVGVLARARKDLAKPSTTEHIQRALSMGIPFTS